MSVATEQTGVAHSSLSLLVFPFFLLLVLSMFMLIGCGDSKDNPEPSYPITKQIRYSFTLKNKGGNLIENSEFRVFGPVLKTSTQETTSIKASAPFETLTDDLGNQILVFQVTVPPYGAARISIDATINLTAEPNRWTLDDGTPFLQAEKYVEVDSPEIQAISQSFLQGDQTDYARLAFDWIREEVERVDYVHEDRGAQYVATQKIGDDTERMYLFTALMRSCGIPARGVGGFVVQRSGVLKTGNYRNWAQFYDKGAWQLADTHAGILRDHEEHYVAMRIIGRGEKYPMGNSHRFVAFHKDLEVRME